MCSFNVTAYSSQEKWGKLGGRLQFLNFTVHTGGLTSTQCTCLFKHLKEVNSLLMSPSWSAVGAQKTNCRLLTAKRSRTQRTLSAPDDWWTSPTLYYGGRGWMEMFFLHIWTIVFSALSFHSHASFSFLFFNRLPICFSYLIFFFFLHFCPSCHQISPSPCLLLVFPPFKLPSSLSSAVFRMGTSH